MEELEFEVAIVNANENLNSSLFYDELSLWQNCCNIFKTPINN